MIRLKIFEFNFFAEHCYVLWDGRHSSENEKDCLIIDPGCQTETEQEELTTFLDENSLRPVAVLLTHCHPDHCFGVAAICRKYDVKVYVNAGESTTLAAMHKLCLGMGADDVEDFSRWMYSVKDGDKLQLGDLEVDALGTPGHSAGGMCYLVRTTEDSKAVLCSGDTLFAGCIGRSDLPGGDYDKLMESIFTKLLGLDGDTEVLPGHGPATTISDERMKNPFLLPFNEPETDAQD